MNHAHRQLLGTLGTILLGWTLGIAPCVARADDLSEPPKGASDEQRAETVTELVVDPAAEPVPALNYHLLPPIELQRPGNAVPIYLRLVHAQADQWGLMAEEGSRLLNDMPLDEMPLEDASKFLNHFTDTLEELSAASRRTDSEWEYVMEGKDPLTILLPDAQSMRNYARLLGVKTRYASRTGDLAGALDSLEAGLALGQHVANAPFLVNQLIGIAISNVMFEQADGFVQQPGAPNLYWALASLPHPLIPLRRGLSSESRWLELAIPELSDLDRPRSEQDWQRLNLEMRRWAAGVPESEGGVASKAIAALRTSTPASAQQLLDARAFLRNRLSLTADKVDAMSDPEVEVRFTVALFHSTADAWRKWFFIPYPKSLPELPRVREALLQDGRSRELYPLVSLLTPVRGSLLKAQARLDRHVARLQAVEALRMHAAATGKLPEKLEDVAVVPVPADPATGRPFRYTRDGEVSVLDVTDEVGMKRETLRMPVRIRLRAK